MPALNEQMTHESYLDRLENQKQALARHIQDLEQQLIETGQHYTAITETLFRLRKKQNKTNKMAAKTEYYS